MLNVYMNNLFKIITVCCILNGCTSHHYEYQYSNLQKIPIKNIKTKYTAYKDNSGFRYIYDFFDGKMRWKYVTDITQENYEITIYTNICEFYLQGLEQKELYNKILKLKDVETEAYYKIETILTKDKNNNVVYRLTGYKFVDLNIRKYDLSEAESE